MFHYYETRYTPIEKSCFALMWAVQKLRHIILLAEFDLKYVARKTIKRSIILDFCAENPVKEEDGREDFPDEDISILS